MLGLWLWQQRVARRFVDGFVQDAVAERVFQQDRRPALGVDKRNACVGGSALLALAKGPSELARERFHSPDDLQILCTAKVCPSLVLGDPSAVYPRPRFSNISSWAETVRAR